MKYLNSSFLLILLASAHVLSAADPISWNLWPGEAPGETVTLPPESYRVTDKDRLTAGKQYPFLRSRSTSPTRKSIRVPPSLLRQAVGSRFLPLTRKELKWPSGRTRLD